MMRLLLLTLTLAFLLNLPLKAETQPLVTLIDSKDPNFTLVVQPNGHYLLSGIGRARFEANGKLTGGSGFVTLEGSTSTHKLVAFINLLTKTGTVKVTRSNGIVDTLTDSTVS